MKKFKLSTGDRIVLGMLLDAGKSNAFTHKIIRQLKETLSFSEKEIEKAQIKTYANGTVNFKPGAADKEIEVGPTAEQFIKDRLIALDTSSQLSAEQLDLYIQFVGEPTPPVEEKKDGDSGKEVADAGKDVQDDKGQGNG